MMNRLFLKVTYRHGKAIAAYVQLPRQTGDHVATTERIDDVLLVDRARDGRPIGIDITDPGQLDPERLFSLLASLGQTEIDRDEFRPLAAA